MSVSFDEQRLFAEDTYKKNIDLDVALHLSTSDGTHWFLTPVDGVQYTDDDVNGFGAALYLKRVNGVVTDAVIAYRGTQPSLTEPQDLLTDLSIALGQPIETIAQFQSAQNFYQNVINNVLPSLGIDPTQIHISFTGHSLGGGLAQYMGAVTGLETSTFNAVGMATQLTHLFDNINTHGFNITNYITNGDFVSNAYDEVGQNYYATIPVSGIDLATRTLNEHLVPAYNESLDLDQHPQPNVTQQDYLSLTPDAISTALYRAREAIQETIPGANQDPADSVIQALYNAVITSNLPVNALADTQKSVGAVAFGDVYEGSNQADLLIGSSVDDILKGDQGNDTLMGGLGSDSYLYNLNDGSDVIKDGSNLAAEANVDGGDDTIVM